MRKVLVALAIGGVVAGLPGVAAASGVAVVHGFVDAASSGRRLAGVCLRLFTPAPSRPVGGPARTSASGQFQFSGLAPGTYVLATCLTGSSPYAEASATVTAAASGAGGTVTLDLVSGGRVSGIVTSLGGRPVRGLQVFAQPTHVTTVSAFIAPAHTSATGRYMITNLAPGRYFVRTSNEVGPGDPWGYDAASTVPLNVTPGRVAHAPRLAVIALGGIVGTAVSSSTGRPLERTCLRAKDQVIVSSTETTPSGRFRFTALLPGVWTITRCFAAHGSGRGHSPPIVVRVGRGSAAGRVRLP